MKVLKILAALKEPRTLAQLEEQFGNGLTVVLRSLEKKGAVSRTLHDRQNARGRQQRRYIYLWAATGVQYITPATERHRASIKELTGEKNGES